MEKYDIIVLGGQSNAEGFGVGNVDNEYVNTENIMWLNDDSKPHFEKNEETGQDELKLSYPSAMNISVAEEPVNDHVLKAIHEVFSAPNRAVVKTDDLLSNNQDTHNGDDIHFCRSSAYELGKRYFAAYEKTRK